MTQPNRREMLGTLGTMAVGGWIGLAGDKGMAQEKPAAASGPKEYALPPLPYAYDALEPYVDAPTMALHHDKHHQAYVNGLNKALAALEAARKSGSETDLARIPGLTMEVAFHGSGHALHTVFWKNMKKGGSEAKGSIAAQIARDFGSLAALQGQFASASKAVQGSGWGILAWEPLSGRTIVLAAEKHQNHTMFGCAPLLVLDVWEHAYYLKYQNNRGAYVDAFWNIVDWDNVSERLDLAKKLTT